MGVYVENMVTFRRDSGVGHIWVLLVFVLLSVNMATDRHIAHSANAKLITFDHQVRRELSRAERENLRTSVMSSRGDSILNPLREVAGVPRSPQFVLNSYVTPRPLIYFESKTLVLDFSPVLNL